MPESAEYLKEGRPLFVLKNAHGNGNAISELIEYGQKLRRGEFGASKVGETIKDTFDYQKFENDFIVEPATWNEAKIIATTFPSYAPRFNPDGNKVFDLNKPIELSSMQDDITTVMSSLYDKGTELGGLEKDLAVLRRARVLMELLSQNKSIKTNQVFTGTCAFLFI